MLYRDPPTADAALFVYLASVLSGVAAFALVGLWLTQPTVIANGGLAAFEKERAKPSVALPRRSPDIDLGESAVALALEENEKQGLRSVADSNQVAPPLASPKAASVATSKVADAPPRSKAKVANKRVAKAQRRDVDPRNDPRNA